MTARLPNLPVYLIHFDRPDWCASSAASIAESIGIVVDLTVVDCHHRNFRL